MKITRVIVHAPHLTGKPPQTPKPIGLGDAVKTILSPMTSAVDRVFGSKLSSCTPCAQRQAKLNELMPDITKLLH